MTCFASRVLSAVSRISAHSWESGYFVARTGLRGAVVEKEIACS